MAYTGSQSVIFTEAEGWSSANPTYSYAQARRQEHILTRGGDGGFMSKADKTSKRYGKFFTKVSLPVTDQTEYHAGERLQKPLGPESSLTGNRRRVRYPASVPNNVPGYVAPLAVTAGNIRGSDIPPIDLHTVRVYAPDDSFRGAPCSPVRCLPSDPPLGPSLESRFSTDSSAHDREDVESSTWNSLRRLCQEIMGKPRPSQPDTPPNTPEDSPERPATSGELASIPGYPVKRARTTGGHLLLRQDTPMDSVRGPSVRASHQAPSVRVSSRWFPTWKKGRHREKAFEYPRYTAHFGNKRAVTESMSVF